jgi:hypothetical protein
VSVTGLLRKQLAGSLLNTSVLRLSDVDSTRKGVAYDGAATSKREIACTNLPGADSPSLVA